MEWKNLDDIACHDFFCDPKSHMNPSELLDFWDAVWESEKYTLTHADVIDGSIRGMQKIAAIAQKIYIITARDENSPIKKQGTIEWMQQHFPMISSENILFSNHLTGAEVTKSSLCKMHGITLLVDDNIHNAMDVVGQGISCILLEKPWNKNDTFEHPLLYRAKNWHEIISCFDD